MFYFAHPWGLLALAGAGAVVFLYVFVFRGKRIEVSSLHLWQAARSLRLEGQRKRRPPLTVPFLFELISALLLALLVAGLAFRRQWKFQHLAVVLDSSASMSAVVDGESFRDRAAAQVMDCFDRLGRKGRVTLVGSGFEPRILGGEALDRRDAAAVLGEWRPSGPDHPLEPAIELARALGQEEASPLLLTDRPVALEGVQVVAVGRPAENTGWISCHWTGGNELFALAEHFGLAQPAKTVTVYGDGIRLAETEIDFSQRRQVPLSVEVPDEVSRVRLELPDDALANDNVLHTVRPVYTALAVRIDLDTEPLARYARRAVAASDRALVTDAGDADVLLCEEGRPPGPERFRLEVHQPEPAASTPYVGPFGVNGFHPLTRGIDVSGVIWPADPAFRPEGGLTLLSCGEVPMAVLKDNTLTVNLDGRSDQLFTSPAWPILIANVMEYVHERSPGLKRLSYRLGEDLGFYRPSSWQGDVEIESPQGERRRFEGEHVYLGRLKREGVYRVYCGDRQVASFDVNLLSESESDLTGAASAGADRQIETAVARQVRGRHFHREFALIVLALLLGCWYLLERRGP